MRRAPRTGYRDQGVSRRSLALSFLEKYASLVIQLGSGLVIARLITPEAFGTFAIAYAIVGFAHVIREMGVSSYLIQLPELEPHHIRAALFATGVVAWSLGLVLFAASPLVARFYGEEVRQTTLILLVSFAIMPLSSTIMATLQREMDFGALLRINLAGTVVGAGVGISVGRAWARRRRLGLGQRGRSGRDRDRGCRPPADWVRISSPRRAVPWRCSASARS